MIAEYGGSVPLRGPIRERITQRSHHGHTSERAEQLFRSHWDELVRHAQIELRGDSSGAEDLAANVVARFASGEFAGRPIPTDKVLTFAKAVIRGQAKHVLRDERRFAALSNQHPAPDSPDPWQRLRSALLARDLSDAFRTSLKRNPK